MSLGLFADCLNTFSAPGHSSLIEIRYPGPDMQLLVKYAPVSLLSASEIFMSSVNREAN